ncbi:MAG: hypothetical protein KGS72_06560 [Cyanobacteria bacterium REEB67]|nr:hypothetical protein [Cyanobacteria bacterium REEB67]
MGFFARKISNKASEIIEQGRFWTFNMAGIIEQGRFRRSEMSGIIERDWPKQKGEV